MIPGGQVVAVNFVPGAGGKFIQNCLALSQHCVFKRTDWAQHQLTHGADYSTKLVWALQTIPQSRNDFSRWLAYELGDDVFYGGLLRDGQPQSFPDYVYEIAQAGLWSTYTSHNHGNAELCDQHWPCVRYVNVLGEQWARQWLPSKNAELAQTIPHWQPAWHTRRAGEFDFDFDAVVHDRSLFLNTIEELFDFLGWNDFSSACNSIDQFYQAYRVLHQ